jgi:hypothetical protein
MYFRLSNAQHIYNACDGKKRQEQKAANFRRMKSNLLESLNATEFLITVACIRDEMWH